MPSPSADTTAGVDVGGTFTDVVLIEPGGHPLVVKLPTTPADQSAGMEQALAAGAGESARVGNVAHGTTTATNAVLERAVARAVLVTTEGFRDLLTIGRQHRPSLYDLGVVRPQPLIPAERVVTVRERMGADGTAVIPLTDDEVDRVVAAVAGLEPESIAVCLLFSFAGAEHELRVCAALSEALDVPVSRSSELLPEFREYERASTCALDAAVSPVMARYLGRVRERLPGAAINVMTSGGGIAGVEAVARTPVHTLLSGPAAGAVAAAAIAREAGFDDGLAFDMGGTSTDVCLITGGEPAIATAGEIGGLPFGTPAVDIHTVGAGGGSIAGIDAGGALQVGPHSAGADPGPACYGRGGTQPTVTDAHLVLGHLVDSQELGSGGLRLDRDAASTALATLGLDSASDAAEGVITVVRATMLRALRRVSTERGVDPGGLALVAYGGAGPLHATVLARELGCRAAVIPPVPGVLSALGLLLSPPRREVSRTVMAVVRHGRMPELDTVWTQLDTDAVAGIADAGTARYADCRYQGQSHELRIERPPDGHLAAAFHRAHHEAYGYAIPDEVVEVVTLRSVARGRPGLEALPATWDFGPAAQQDHVDLVVEGRSQRTPIIHRQDLTAGETVEGPALLVQSDSTTLLDAADRATVTTGGSLVVTW